MGGGLGRGSRGRGIVLRGCATPNHSTGRHASRVRNSMLMGDIRQPRKRFAPLSLPPVCQLQFPAYSLGLQRRHDNGKPGASLGRKATGPLRVAELPNVDHRPFGSVVRGAPRNPHRFRLGLGTVGRVGTTVPHLPSGPGSAPAGPGTVSSAPGRDRGRICEIHPLP